MYFTDCQNKWDALIAFNRKAENKFISNDLNVLFGKYVGALDELYNCVLANFYSDDKESEPEIFYRVMAYSENGEAVPKDLQEELDRQTFYKITHSPIYTDHEVFYEKKSNLINKLYSLTENVRSKWSEFRLEIKSKLKK